jgi:RHH-type rel operon transcriptional repressor/antitoxin RelB
MLAVRISKELEDRLDRLAKKTQRSKSYYVKKSLEAFLGQEEERQIAIDAYDAYLKSGKKTYTFEEVMRESHLRD